MKITYREAEMVIINYLNENGSSSILEMRVGLDETAKTFPLYIQQIVRSMYLRKMLGREKIEGSRKYRYYANMYTKEEDIKSD